MEGMRPPDIRRTVGYKRCRDRAEPPQLGEAWYAATTEAWPAASAAVAITASNRRPLVLSQANEGTTIGEQPAYVLLQSCQGAYRTASATLPWVLSEMYDL
jgi:hypothetical protein